MRLVGALAVALATGCHAMVGLDELFSDEGAGGAGPECTLPAQCPQGTTCRPATCAAGKCGFVAVAAGTACSEKGGKVCDGEGACVQCHDGSQDCGPGVTCIGGMCADASCPVPGGTFPMGRSEGDADAYPGGDDDEQPEHQVTVSGYRLDAYEITVGRFRTFVEAGKGTQQSPPAAGAGKHPEIAQGSGWQQSYNGELATDTAALKAELGKHVDCTWTDAPAGNESYPVNCITWYEAFAFCAWDGGRLPTEAEWEHAAAGGSENRLYPWGQSAAGSGQANYSGEGNSPFEAVGSFPAGKGRWGQHDLGGSIWEWVLDWYESDWYAGGGNGCDDCANLAPGSRRVVRGGCWLNVAWALRAANRYSGNPRDRNRYVGARCARSAP
ncbi:MAG: formylglycine-generating enzyme family protein [Deltaproteobacteria bacterium]|nr:formylglycine-generating enzyme family protein [Deltaproteobacteria bacterium]